MSSDWIKISECNNRPVFLLYHILEQIFDQEFCCTIWIRCSKGHILSKWGVIVSPIDRCRRRENNLLYSKFLHNSKQMNTSSYIIIMVHIWMITTLAYCLKSSKVNHYIKRIFFKNRNQKSSISDISLIKIRNISKDFRNSLKRISRRVDKIINNHRLISGLLKSNDRVGTNISSSSCKQNSLLSHKFMSYK